LELPLYIYNLTLAVSIGNVTVSAKQAEIALAVKSDVNGKGFP